MNEERIVRLMFDEDRPFGFSFSTLKLLTKELGGSLEALGESVDLETLTKIVAIGLMIGGEPRRKSDEVDALIDAYLDNGGTLEALGASINEALVKGGYAKRSEDADQGNREAPGASTT